MNQDDTREAAPDPEGWSRTDAILRNLLQAGNLERLESEAKRLLAFNPEEATAHYYLTLASIDLKKFREAKRHLDHLLAAEPDAVRSHIAAVCFYGATENQSMLRRHLAEGLSQNPDVAYFHQYAAIADLRQMRLEDARRNITRARELSPDDADIVNLYIRIHGVAETSAEDALRRLEAYRNALQLDPHSAPLHQSIGDIYLNDLEEPEEAEKFFREALRIDPTNRGYQRDLFDAVARRSVIYRLFSIPSRTFTWLYYVGKGLANQPWRILFLLLGFKLVIVFFLWLLLSTLLFWPGGKVYEWLLVSEIKTGTATSLAGMRAWFWLRRWPRWVRFGMFLAANLILWGALFAAINVPVGQGYVYVTVVTAIHFFFVCVFWNQRRLSAAAAKRKSQRKNIPG